jgi:hypothetical protein
MTILFPISAQGVIYDTDSARSLSDIMKNITDVFIYSHGWWTNTETAIVRYNAYLIGLLESMSKVESPLGIGILWPSILNENTRSLENIFEPFTFSNRAAMADIVGANGVTTLLKLLLKANNKIRLHFIGHSFGCRVVCSALNVLSGTGLLINVQTDVVLIQAAFDNNALEIGQSYGNIFIQIPQIRMLITKSDLDMALGDMYLTAGLVNLEHGPIPAMGSTGPSKNTPYMQNHVTNNIDISYNPVEDYIDYNHPLTVADLTTLHHVDNYIVTDQLMGHHSDVFHKQIYQLIVRFMGI